MNSGSNPIGQGADSGHGEPESSITIRRPTIEDVPECLGVSASRNDDFFHASDFKKALEDRDALFLVAESSGRLVGFIMAYVNPTKHEEAIIQSTMVHVSYGGRGVGSKLVRTLADTAFRLGAKRIFAEVEDGPDKFYERCGFRRVHEWHSMLLSPEGDEAAFR